MTKETLQKQITQFEAELENAKAMVYRVDGALQATKHLLAEFDQDETPPEIKES